MAGIKCDFYDCSKHCGDIKPSNDLFPEPSVANLMVARLLGFTCVEITTSPTTGSRVSLWFCSGCVKEVLRVLGKIDVLQTSVNNKPVPRSSDVTMLNDYTVFWIKQNFPRIKDALFEKSIETLGINHININCRCTDINMCNTES